MSNKSGAPASRLRFWLLTAALAIASALVGLAGGHRLQQSPPVRSQSEVRAWFAEHPPTVYVAQYEERLTTTAGRKGVGRTVLEGVREDGSRVLHEQFFNIKTGKPSYTDRHLFLAQGVLVSIWDEMKVYSAQRSSVAVHPESDGPRLDPDDNCRSNYLGQTTLRQAGPDETLLGFRAIHLQSVVNGKSATIETWRLPAIGCIQARRLATFKDKTGAVADTSDLVAISIRAVPPDAALFNIPSDYQAVSPSDAMERLRALRGAPPMSASTRLLLQQADANYLKNRVDISSLR